MRVGPARHASEGRVGDAPRPRLARDETIGPAPARQRIAITRQCGKALRFSEHLNGVYGEAMFRHACAMGLEGIVSKRVGSRYVSGRTRAWLKTKNPHFER